MEYIARISWLSPEEGGRKGQIPYNTNRYGPLIRHKNGRGNWSVLVNNYEQLGNLLTLAKIQYLNTEKAPKDLAVGLRFELYEGPQKVADGEIIDH